VTTKASKPRKSKKAMAADVVAAAKVPASAEDVVAPAPPAARFVSCLHVRPDEEACPACTAMHEECRRTMQGAAIDLKLPADSRPTEDQIAAAAAAAIAEAPPPHMDATEGQAFRRRLLNRLTVFRAARLLQRDYALDSLRQAQKQYDRLRLEAEDLQRRIDRLKARMRQDAASESKPPERNGGPR
jgi:hypothetical protein